MIIILVPGIASGSQDTIRVNLGSFPKGDYSIRLTGPGTMQVGKLIKL